MKAIVRYVASSFAQAITSQAASIDLGRAQQQHGAYVQLLRNILGQSNVIGLPADDKHPGESAKCSQAPGALQAGGIAACVTLFACSCMHKDVCGHAILGTLCCMDCAPLSCRSNRWSRT